MLARRTRMMCWRVLLGGALLIMTACTGPASVAPQLRSREPAPTSPIAANTSQTNAHPCPITVSVKEVHAQTPTQYPLGGVINVTVGQRLVVAAIDHCAPTLQARAQPGGVLKPVVGLPGAFLAVATGNVTLIVTYAMCDQSPWPGCRGGIAVATQFVRVDPPVA